MDEQPDETQPAEPLGLADVLRLEHLAFSEAARKYASVLRSAGVELLIDTRPIIRPSGGE